MSVVGTATVLVRPSFTGFQKTVEKELGGSGTAGGQAAAGGFGASFAKWGKRAMVAGGAAAIAGVGVALTKGFGRLTQLENARAKMRGLGHDSEAVDAIMKNALASVKGTSFGLGDAATVAASAVAAGIKPGEQLEGVLKSVANSAAAAGVDMGEMGSIYTKVASVGKAQNDSLQQVANRGIPIYQALADQLGVTTDEVFKMASAGKIGFDEFEKAMTTASGTVAEEMGKTFTGSLSNAWAAVGRVGANLLTGVFDKFAPAIQGVTGWLGRLEPIALKVGESIGAFLDKALAGASALYDLVVGGNFTAAFRDAFGVEEDHPLVGTLLRLRDIGGSVFSEITGGIRAFAEAWKAGDGDVTSSGLPGFLEQVAGVGRQLFDFLRSRGVPAFRSVADVIQRRIVPVLRTFIESIRENALPMIRTLGDFLRDKILPAFRLVAGFILDTLVPAVASIAATVIETVYPILTKLVEVFRERILPALLSIAGVVTDKVIPFLVRLANVVVPVVKWIVELAAKILRVVVPVLLDLAGRVLGFVGKAFGWLLGVAFDAFNGIFDVISKVVGWIRNTAWPWLKTAFENIGKVAKWLYENMIRPQWILIRAAIDTVAKFIKDKVWPVIRDVFGWIGAKAKDLWENWIKPNWDRIKGGIDVVARFIRDTVWPIIKAAFDSIAGRARWLWNEGVKPWFDRLKTGVDAVKSAFEKAQEGIGKAWDKIKEKISSPIRASITFVNDKLIKNVNRLFSFLEMDQIPEIKMASGGVLPGYTPGRDVHEFVGRAGRLLLSGGEAIMRPEFTRAIGRGGVERFNRLARTGGVSAVRDAFGTDRFALGGIWGRITSGANWVKNKATDALSSLAETFLKNPLKHLKDLLAGMGGDGPFAKATQAATSLSLSKIANLFQRSSEGDLSGIGTGTGAMQWQAIWQMIRSVVPGARMTSNYRPGAITALGNRSMHGMGRAVDFVSPNMGRAFQLLKPLRAWTQLFYSGSGGGGILRGRPWNMDPVTRRNHYCVPLDVLILTQRGWLKHDELRIGEDVTLGLNWETGLNEWTLITDVHRYEDAEVFETGTRQSWRVQATAGHRWIARDSRSGKPRWVTTDDLTQSPWVVAAEAVDGPGLDLTLDEAELIGWLVTDGSQWTPKGSCAFEGCDNPSGAGLCGSHQRQKRHGAALHPLRAYPRRAQAKTDLYVWQTKPKGVARLREILPEGEATCNGKGFRLRKMYALDLLSRAGLTHIKDAAELTAMLYAMSREQRGALLKGIDGGDGAARKHGCSPRICQNAGPLADFIALVGYVTGHRVDMQLRGDRGAGVSMSRPYASTYRTERVSLGEQPVWCPTTELGSWTAAFDGNPVLTGNSHVHAAMAEGGIVKPFVADSGVTLAPGLNLLNNKLGKPEPLRRADRDGFDYDALARALAPLIDGVERGSERGTARGMSGLARDLDAATFAGVG